jgi:2,4-dienoyl-CoA reductase-like NADH-dependent reductase (Old Yellow Enzyme family)
VTDLSTLFTPFALNGVELPNRFVMAPMTRARSPGGVAGDDLAQYYARRARGGVGLIITEGIWIDEPSASYMANVPVLGRADQLQGLGRVADAVHEAGGRVFIQLWHAGLHRASLRLGADAPPVLSPSGVAPGGEAVGSPMTNADIARVIDAYGQGAQESRRLGFDGVEIHGAHGYLPDQFLSASINHRTDLYGGEEGARARFAAEVVAECRRRTTPDFPIGFRLSQWKLWDYEARIADTPRVLGALLSPLAAAGVDVFHCSTRRHWEAAFEGSPLGLAGWVKALTGKPVITVGSVGLGEALDTRQARRSEVPLASLDPVLEQFARNEFDLVAIGRALLANPDWVAKMREGRAAELKSFDPRALTELS